VFGGCEPPRAPATIDPERLPWDFSKASRRSELFATRARVVLAYPPGWLLEIEAAVAPVRFPTGAVGFISMPGHGPGSAGACSRSAGLSQVLRNPSDPRIPDIGASAVHGASEHCPMRTRVTAGAGATEYNAADWTNGVVLY